MSPGSQAGAALAVGLFLLSILTVLAVSTLSTATLELTMSGNDVFRTRALQAAETGVARTLAAGVFNLAAPEAVKSWTFSNGDAFTTVTRPCGATAAPPGFNPVFSAEHFTIESTGTSPAGASVTVVQGLFVVRPLAAAPSAPASALPVRCLTGIEILPAACVAPGTAVRTFWRYGSSSSR